LEARKGSPNGDSHSEEWDHATWFFARGVGLLASAEILAGVSEAKETLDTVHELDVPFYLHPRSPLATRQQAYEGHEWIAGSPWDLQSRLRYTLCD
jgi:hypothetical protein